MIGVALLVAHSLSLHIFANNTQTSVPIPDPTKAPTQPVSPSRSQSITETKQPTATEIQIQNSTNPEIPELATQSDEDIYTIMTEFVEESQPEESSQIYPTQTSQQSSVIVPSPTSEIASTTYQPTKTEAPPRSATPEPTQKPEQTTEPRTDTPIATATMKPTATQSIAQTPTPVEESDEEEDSGTKVISFVLGLFLVGLACAIGFVVVRRRPVPREQAEERVDEPLLVPAEFF